MRKRLNRLNSILEKNDNYNLNEYKCYKCRDLKYIIQDSEAIPCECKAKIESEDRFKKSELGIAFQEKTFNNYRYDINEQCTDAMIACIKFCDKVIKENKNVSVLLAGNSGAGKTHLATAIANKLMDNGISVIYMPYRESIINLKQNAMDGEKYNNIINKFKREKVLLIDDLFKGNITSSDINIVFELINYRYLNKLSTIISTEKTLKELLNIDEAIASRIVQMSSGYIVQFIGENLNYRLSNSKV